MRTADHTTIRTAAGGLTLEQVVLASMEIREGRAQQQKEGSAAPD